jgi:hypothetical protein
MTIPKQVYLKTIASCLTLVSPHDRTGLTTKQSSTALTYAPNYLETTVLPVTARNFSSLATRGAISINDSLIFLLGLTCLMVVGTMQQTEARLGSGPAPEIQANLADPAAALRPRLCLLPVSKNTNILIYCICLFDLFLTLLLLSPIRPIIGQWTSQPLICY